MKLHFVAIAACAGLLSLSVVLTHAQDKKGDTKMEKKSDKKKSSKKKSEKKSADKMDKK